MTELRLIDSLTSIDAAQWDALHDGGNPFVRYAFLSGLEQHGCLRNDWGWNPLHATLWEGTELIGAAPGYLKTNSHGEFVFDHAWAQAYARYGHDYYPKWLIGVPYTPVTGPRLLARDDLSRQALAAAIAMQTKRLKLSSAHINFLPDHEIPSLESLWLARCDIQYHWKNTGNWQCFDDFLNALSHKKRKNIRQERAHISKAGFSFRIVNGHNASTTDIACMHHFYQQTFEEKYNSPALTLAFFQHLASTMPQAFILILANKDQQCVAGAMCLRGTDTLYGRYWGCDDNANGLHFETCYYQGIDYCLREGLSLFEPGAQGEHKVARGFLPVLTHSRHSIVDNEFAKALNHWCSQERASILRYCDVVMSHSPYRDTETPQSS